MHLRVSIRRRNCYAIQQKDLQAKGNTTVDQLADAEICIRGVRLHAIATAAKYDGRLDALETEGRESREVEAVVIRAVDRISVSPLQSKDLYSRHPGDENWEIVSRHKRRITTMSNCQLGQIPGGRN